MTNIDSSQITSWLTDWRAGDEAARDRLFAVVSRLRASRTMLSGSGPIHRSRTPSSTIPSPHRWTTGVY